MIFRQFIHEEKSCLSYMIGCVTKGTVAVVDPQADLSIYLDTAERHGLSIDYVIDTHTHADHLSGARQLVQFTGATLIMHENSEVEGVGQKVRAGDTINVGNRRIEVLATPGHTTDSITLHVDNWYLLTGDTLFVGDIGRVDLALGEISGEEIQTNAGKLYDSIQKLKNLPEWTEIYPGHFAGSSCGKGLSSKMISTIGREKIKNEALAMPREQFVQYVTSNQPDMQEGYKQIKKTNITAL